MKKVLLLSVYAVFIAAPAIFAQKIIESHWGKKYPDFAFAAAATDDGGYIITGLTQSGADTVGDIVVIKTNMQADTLWTLVYGGSKLEGGNAVIQTADGGYMISGHTEDFGAKDCDAFLMKLNRDGKRDWLKVYGGEEDDISEGVIELPTGEFVFAGITASYGNAAPGGPRHAYFVKTDRSGNVIWEKYYAGKGTEYGYSIVALQQGGFLAAGYSSSWGNGELDAWLLRLNDNGDTLWTRLYKNGGDSKFYKILPTIDNGYILAGYTGATKTSYLQGFAVKLDANGNELWQKTYGNTDKGSLLFHDVVQLPNGNYIFTGNNYITNPAGHIYVLNTDANGIMLKEDEYGGVSSGANCIAAQGNNSYLVGGISPKFGDDYGDLYYLEVDNTNTSVPVLTNPQPRVYPNPVKDKLSITLPAPEAYQSVSIDVININGQLVWSKQNIMAKDIVIDRTALPDGSYIFKVLCKDGKLYKGKFEID